MTKKDYELIAKGLRQVLEDNITSYYYWQQLGNEGMATLARNWKQGTIHAIYAVCNALGSQDDHFLRSRFLHDCGIED